MHSSIYSITLLALQLGFTALVSGSTLADLPSCALPCAEKNVDATGCGTDVDCLCGQNDFQKALAACVKTSCSEDDQCNFVGFTKKACPNVVVSNAPLKCREGFVHESTAAAAGAAATSGAASAGSGTGSGVVASGASATDSNGGPAETGASAAYPTNSGSSAAAGSESSSSSSGSGTNGSPSKTPIGPIVGGVVGGIAVLGILILGGLYIWRRGPRKQAATEPDDNGRAEMDANTTATAAAATSAYKQQAELGTHEKAMSEAPGNDMNSKGWAGSEKGRGASELHTEQPGKGHGASELYAEQPKGHGASELYTEPLSRHELP